MEETCHAELQSSIGLTVISVHSKQCVTLLKLRAHEFGSRKGESSSCSKQLTLINPADRAELRHFKTTCANNA